MENRVCIEVKGGVIQSVTADREIQVVVLDYDAREDGAKAAVFDAQIAQNKEIDAMIAEFEDAGANYN